MIKLKELLEVGKMTTFGKKYKIKIKPKKTNNSHKWYYKKGHDLAGKTLIVYDSQNPNFDNHYDLNKQGGSYFISKDNAVLIKKLTENEDFENVSWPKEMGKFECSLGKDKDGYFCYTHRARSNSYPSPQQIPKSKIKFIESTG